MFFNDIHFFLFFIPVLIATLVFNKIGNVKIRNIVLLIASYWFYAQFSWTYLISLAYVTLVNYVTVLALDKQKKKGIITACVVLSLLPLFGYKYLHFILTDVCMLQNTEWCHWLLPVGISFFTFQALTYSIDFYRGKITKKENLLDYALFVSFFPTILSGPIERSRTLIPQLKTGQKWNGSLFVNGIELFVWGLFKKIVIADRISYWLGGLYAEPMTFSGNSYALGILLYSIQIYCDFSGYSDMAIGVGRMMGFKLRKNFDFPYLSTTIKSFWRKWHISLTSWFSEYLYIACGGNRVAKWRWYVNISLVFLVSGIWHGAAWTFIVWGAMHALFYLIEHLFSQSEGDNSNTIATIIKGISVYILVSLAWVFFRADSFTQALEVIGSVSMPWDRFYMAGSAMTFAVLLMSIVVFLIADMLCYFRVVTLNESEDNPYRWVNLSFTVLIALYTALFGMSGTSFIYFQF